jgi:hypothetical protein
VRIAVFALAASALVVLTGCTATTVGTGSAAPVGTASAPAGPSSGPTASPARWSNIEAQQYYLEYIYQGDDDYTYLDSLPCLCSGQVPLADITGVCQRIVVDNNLTVEDFSNGAWPTDVASAVKALIAAMSARRKGYTACANATSLSAASAGLRKVMPITPEALAVRRILGLPLTPEQTPTPTAAPTPVASMTDA